jgi:DNA-binding MarR family transcriptional regulator
MATGYNNFKILITKISRQIHQIEEHEMRAINLKSQHISCLYYLLLSEKLRAKDIVDYYLEDKGQVSRSLDFLEKNGYIVCESTAQKRYNAYYYLTDKGKEIAKYVEEKIDEIVFKVSDSLSEKERIVMYKCLSTISKNLEKIKE